MTPQKVRIRRSKEESKSLILESAEALLRSGGPGAVSMRSVAERIGLTDAAVSHHFGTRQELFEALLRHGGRRLKQDINAALEQWRAEDSSLQSFVTVIADLYADGVYSELALQLHMSGWRDRGSGMLDMVVNELHQIRAKIFAARGARSPALWETQFVVGLMHQTMALDPLFGKPFRRSAGVLGADEPTRVQKARMWTAILTAILEFEFEHSA